MKKPKVKTFSPEPVLLARLAIRTLDYVGTAPLDEKMDADIQMQTIALSAIEQLGGETKALAIAQAADPANKDGRTTRRKARR